MFTLDPALTDFLSLPNMTYIALTTKIIHNSKDFVGRGKTITELLDQTPPMSNELRH